jgi:hypothetical protein
MTTKLDKDLFPRFTTSIEVDEVDLRALIRARENYLEDLLPVSEREDLGAVPLEIWQKAADILKRTLDDFDAIGFVPGFVWSDPTAE